MSPTYYVHINNLQHCFPIPFFFLRSKAYLACGRKYGKSYLLKNGDGAGKPHVQKEMYLYDIKDSVCQHKKYFK